MRLSSSSADEIQLRGRGRIGTPLIVGSVLLCWPILATCIADTPLTTDRSLASGILVLVAATFIRFGWPKARVIRLRPKESSVTVDGRRAWQIPTDAALRLGFAPAEPVAGPLRYAVVLEARGVEPLRLLSAEDPSRVLNDLVELRRWLPLPVLAGWGLSRDAIPWLEGVTSMATPAEAAADDPVEPTRRRAATGLGIGTAGAASLLATEMHGRASRGDIPSTTSMVLPVLSVCLLAVLTFVIAVAKPRVSAGSDVSFEWRIGAFRLFPRVIPGSDVRSAEVVSPTGTGGRHLLVETRSRGFVAFPCHRREGRTVAERITAELRAS